MTRHYLRPLGGRPGDLREVSRAAILFFRDTIDLTTVLITYTYYGDADFNGKVDGGDYARIDFTFGQESTSGNIGGWINGDFDGNGKVDGSDYGLMDFTFSSQGDPIRPPLPAAVPAGGHTIGNASGGIGSRLR